ncbi:MAG: peptidylprolyl isomerase [Planctomycetota bacterium]
MNSLTTLVCVPLFAAFSVLPAQETAKAQDSKKPQKIEDTEHTKKDAAIKALDKFIKKQTIDRKTATWKARLTAPPKQEFDSKCDYLWHVETSAGNLTIRYFPETAPMHVTSGIYLARLGYYDGLKFHRIIPRFMAQGGCPFGRGNGGPGYFMDGEFEGNLKHDRPGLLSMANTGRPRSDGGQFFLTFVPTPHLNGKHTIWGEVIEGMDTVKALEKLGTRGGKVAKPPTMVRTWIEVKPKKADKDAAHDGDASHGEEHGGEKKAENGGGL